MKHSALVAALLALALTACGEKTAPTVDAKALDPSAASNVEAAETALAASAAVAAPGSPVAKAAAAIQGSEAAVAARTPAAADAMKK